MGRKHLLMAKKHEAKPTPRRTRKPLAWLHGEIKTPPFTAQGRREAGELLRLLQEGETLGMPHAEPLPIVGPNCGAIRVRDAGHNWRIVYRVDPDAVVILEVYAKKTQQIPQEVIDVCKRRLKSYDEVLKSAAKRSARKSRKGDTS